MERLTKWIRNVSKFFCLPVDEQEQDNLCVYETAPVLNPLSQERSTCVVSTHFHSDEL